jgi:hypothetical protein
MKCDEPEAVLRGLRHIHLQRIGPENFVVFAVFLAHLRQLMKIDVVVSTFVDWKRQI